MCDGAYNSCDSGLGLFFVLVWVTLIAHVSLGMEVAGDRICPNLSEPPIIHDPGRNLPCQAIFVKKKNTIPSRYRCGKCSLEARVQIWPCGYDI